MDFKGIDNVRADADIREEKQPYVLTQYSASPIILGLLGQTRKALDAQTDLEGFYDTLFSLERVGEYGMDVWGRILNISRTFVDPTSGIKYTVSGENFRLLLWLKALANISPADLYTANELLGIALKSATNGEIDYTIIRNDNTVEQREDGTYYTSHSMHVRILMDGTIDSTTRAIISALLPSIIAAGVYYTWAAYDTDSTFGFLGSELQPFNQGSFIEDGAIMSPYGS